MEPITDADAQRGLRRALLKWVATTAFWTACVAVVGLGGGYLVVQRGMDLAVPWAILLFTFGSGAWFWIRESWIAWQEAKAKAGLPTLR